VSGHLRKYDARTSNVQISPRRRHRPRRLRRHFSSFQGPFWPRTGNGSRLLRNANASLFYLRIEDITLNFFSIFRLFFLPPFQFHISTHNNSKQPYDKISLRSKTPILHCLHFIQSTAQSHQHHHASRRTWHHDQP
jgi:hypothetical protein